MTNHVCRSVLASLFLFVIGACGDDSDPSPGQGDDGATTCGTLTGMPCGCPGPVGTYGVFACDGSCTQCPAPAAGSGAAGVGAGRPGSGAAGSTATGFAGRSGAAGRGVPVSGSGGPPGRGAAGVSSAAGSGAPPVAGSGGMPAGGGVSADAGVPPAVAGTITGDVPDSAVCAPVAAWPAEASTFETEVLRLVNENRAMGWNCDTEGQFPAAGPLTMNPLLRCSARLHSKDMADRMFFAHDNPEGENPGVRMKEAGFSGRGWGENIARGQRTPAEVVAGWMDSDGHCSNIMNASFNQLGVGYFAGMATNTRFNSELYWTQNFGASSTPRP